MSFLSEEGHAGSPLATVDAAQDLLHAELGTPLRGVAAGQSLVIYGGADGDRVLAQATVASAQVHSHPVT